MSDTEKMEIEAGQNTYPVLPLRDIVVFPYMIVPLFVGREKSVRALEDVMNKDKQIVLVTQREANEENPTEGDLFSVSTLGTVLQPRNFNPLVTFNQNLDRSVR